MYELCAKLRGDRRRGVLHGTLFAIEQIVLLSGILLQIVELIHVEEIYDQFPAFSDQAANGIPLS
jgi:hypothetical protein